MTILAIHPGALGDLILLAHLLRRLDAPVTLIASADAGSLLVRLGAVSSCLDFSSLPFHELFTDAPLSSCSLSRLLPRADLLISCFPPSPNAPGSHPVGSLSSQTNPSLPQSRLVSLCGASSSAFLPIRPPAGFPAHLTDLWSDLLNLPRLAVSPFPFPGHPGKGPKEPKGPKGHGTSTLSPSSSPSALSASSAVSPSLLVHPGAGSPAKCWPLDRFCTLARSFPGARLVLGPVELERWPASTVASLQREFPTLLAPSLPDLAAAITHASACLGNDSAFCHLAAALGSPTLALFGPTNPIHFRPLGPRVQVLAAPSMEDIPLSRVLSALHSLGRPGEVHSLP